MARSVRAVPLIALILAGLAMIGPFSIDTYLPSFPAIGREFAASAAGLQQTLSIYFATFAVMTLFHGTLSDSFGRRPVILACLALYIAASIGCALAGALPDLILFRALQGLTGGAGMVVGRAIIRDSFEGQAAQRLMALVMMIFGLAPAVAPVVGGVLQSVLGWRSIFVFLALYGLVLLGICWWRLPETHPPAARAPFALGSLARDYVRLGSSPRLALLCAVVGFNFAGFFIYIVSAPAFIYGLLGLGENDFAWLFVPGIAGVMAGAFLSGRFAGVVAPRRTVKIAYTVMFAAAAFNVAYSALFPPALPWSVLPVMGYTVGMSLAMPSITLMALELFPRHRGMTASLQSFVQSLLSGVLAGAISPLLSRAGVTLALGMAGLLFIAWACWMAYLRIETAAR